MGRVPVGAVRQIARGARPVGVGTRERLTARLRVIAAGSRLAPPP
jgi:hypothetical protein